VVSRIQIAKPDIVAKFETLPRVLRADAVAHEFNENREFWRLTKSTSFSDFVSFMLQKTALQNVRFEFPQRPVSGFTWGEPPLLEVLLGLVDKSFYSHFTAVRLHGLTEQVPKTIYLNHERAGGYSGPKEKELFAQEAIDAAFRQPPRASNNEVTHRDVRIVFLSSANQGMLGVTSAMVNYGEDRDLELRFTNLERTLIDIVVRPFYAGGVFEVAKAYENAKDKLSVNTMAAMLRRMEFGYPYHQAVGFYLERAGYKPSLVDMFKKQPIERDFYLTHNMGEMQYVPQWRLHVPKGF
jgi:hypothetical protein